MKNILIITLFLSLIISFSSCSKYEEGAHLTVKTKKSRLTNRWYAESIEQNGLHVHIDNWGDYLEFERDNECRTGQNGSWYESVGTWQFSDDKLYINAIFVYPNGATYITQEVRYRIIKLSKNKLILEHPDGQIIHYTN